MKTIKTERLCILLFFMLFSLPIVHADFQVWSERTGVFTIGKNNIVNVYVQNLGSVQDSYSITHEKKDVEDFRGNDASHLLSVNMPSDRIEFVDPNGVKATFATINILGPIKSGNVTFNITSDGSGISRTTSILIQSPPGTPPFPTSLPEFKLVGLIQLLILASLLLVVSDPSHHSDKI